MMRLLSQRCLIRERALCLPPFTVVMEPPFFNGRNIDHRSS